MVDETNKTDAPAFEAPKILEKPNTPPKPSGYQGGQGTKKVVAVNFHRAGKIYDFESADLTLAIGETVIVEADEGLGYATVAIATRSEPAANFDRPLKKVIRKTSYDDLRQHQKNKEREKLAFDLARQRIRQYNLDMKVIHVEYLHSGAKAILFFASEIRVDFRNLVRDLAQELHTRIEMRQVGPRDEAKMMGAIGVCGRELCCSTWLRDFDPISIKMAKEQELSLNPSKLAGQCGRLKCCLAYEYETYISLKKGLPKVGKKVCWKDGTPCGRVAGHNVFSGTIRVMLEDGTEKVVPSTDVLLASTYHRKDEPPEPPEPQGQEDDNTVQ